MDFRPDLEFPIEKELAVYRIKENLHTLRRKELEDAFVEMSGLLVKLTFQSNALFKYAMELEGKLEELTQ
jgi:hypothetical protein